MKGISLTFEAAIASILLLSVIIFFFKPLQSSQTSEVNHKVAAYNGLKISDEAGGLRENALENNATAIKNDLSAYISYLDYDVAIFNKTSNLTAVPSISLKDVISVSYFLAGDVGNYSASEVRVFLWGLD
jgi:hypothetical protein